VQCDATQESELAGKYDVKGYPTIKWFIDGQIASDYNGDRTAEGIVNWLKKKTGPFAATLDSADKLAELETENPILMLAYFSAFEGAEYEAFKSVGSAIEDVVFVQTTDAAVAKAAGLTASGFVAIKNPVGEARETVAFEGTITAEPLKAFITAEKMPLTIEFSQTSSSKIFNSGIAKQIIFWASAADLSAESTSFAALRSVAKAFKGKLVFVTANNEGESHEPITNYFGLKGANSPSIVGFFMEKNQKFGFPSEEVTVETLTSFAQSIVDGTAQATYKSAAIPDEPTDEGVTVVVGKNFDSIVMDPTKDVLLEVYAPWCGHCKKLDPIYKKLAKRFASIESVVIAKMDGTENEHPLAEAKGYPTLLFFPAVESKRSIPFEGDRTLKGMTKFIKQQAKVEYELPKKSAKEEADDKDEL
jgi:protein disulfide-isomerase A1